MREREILSSLGLYIHYLLLPTSRRQKFIKFFTIYQRFMKEQQYKSENWKLKTENYASIGGYRR